MYKLIKKSDYNYLTSIEIKYDEKCQECNRLKKYFAKQQRLFSNLTRVLKNNEAIIYDIQPNRYGITTYICLKDNRDDDGNKELSIFVINSEIDPTEKNNGHREMPYLDAIFSDNQINLLQLRCDMKNGLYEKQGYATMILNALKQIAKESNRHVIKGRLYEGDAQTEEEKKNRNDFYINYGFSIKFDDETCESGSFQLAL